MLNSSEKTIFLPPRFTVNTLVLCRKLLSNSNRTWSYVVCKTVVCPVGFSILAKGSCNFKLEIQESSLIELLKPTLNKKISSLPHYRYIWFDIDCVTIHYSENRRSNLINFWLVSLIWAIEMLCKCISLSCVKVYWTLQV